MATMSAIFLLLVLITVDCYGVVGPEHSQVDIDLSTGVVRGYSDQILFLLTPTKSADKNTMKTTGQRCSRKAIIRVDLDSNRFKVARIVLKYGDSPRRWTFDVSDSPLADGYGSIVSSTESSINSNQTATTELHVLNKQLRVYGRWPPPSHNIYSRSSSQKEGHQQQADEDEVSEEGSSSSEESDDDDATSTKTTTTQMDESGVKEGASSSTKLLDSAYINPLLGSRMFMRVIDDTVRPNFRVELLVGSKGKSMWWRDGRNAHHIPAPPGFLKRRSGSYLYVSFNRVLAGDWRAGEGLCSVSVQMMETEDQCPTSQLFCDKNAICKPSSRGYQCSCKKGWQGNGTSCIDIDECRIKNGGCAHTCVNEPGSYVCTCFKGFMQDPIDPDNCIDIDECTLENNKSKAAHDCQQICSNVIGSYECQCYDGYNLAQDRRKCEAGSPSCLPKLGCKHGCKIDYSSHVGAKVGLMCTCPDGYILDERDMKSCIPTCAVGNGGCQHHCLDVPMTDGPIRKGLFISNWKPLCTCQPKYILGPDGKSCSASCSVNNGGCQKRCTTTDTGVVCSCPNGYVLNNDGKTCIDIDECISGNITCEYGCVNSIGSFECICPSGYRLNATDERTCLDIDECSIENTCEQICVNLPGSYQCKCRQGYQLFGISHCGDINECYVNNGGCSHICINTEGSYYCTCNSEQRLHANGKDCIGVENPNSFSCGRQTKYRSLSGETSEEIPSINSQRCLDPVSSPRYIITGRFFFTGTKCSTLAQMKAASQTLIEELNASNVQNCSNECKLQVVKVKCENSKRMLKKLGKENGDVIRVLFQIISQPKIDSASCKENCNRKSTTRMLRQAATHLKKFFNGAPRFSIKPLEEELVIIPKSFHTRRNVQHICYDNSKTSREGCGFFCPSGTFSSNGYHPCLQCPSGTFQPFVGRLSCIPAATNEKMKVVYGAKTFTEASALEPCSLGKFYNKDTKACDYCPKGSYQHQSGQNFCFKCPGNSSTDYNGSKTVDDCKRRTCSSFINETKMYGVIESPNYPGNYPNNIDCTWIVKPGKGRRLLVIVPDIKIANDNCGDYLVMRKSKSAYTVTTYEACKSSHHPIAFTARSKKLWMQFKSNGNNTAGGFQIPFVTYNEEYQALIEDIVQDSRLYASVNHLRILQDRKLLLALMEVIAQPINYYKYANQQRKILPSSFIRLMTPKVRKFFSYK